ncbi:hypothetical protein C8R46DRAFT_1223749 [Mycena filopes]|nr:hypothetical protein C8R46DRAFT_1223749 [Mycena filopes]
MSSLDALNARIEELSVAISDLEIQRSNARRDLNALRDPMARLPLEISSEIFIQLLADDDGSTPMIFLPICRLWKDIALSTPSLWATVYSDVTDAPPFCQYFQTWLARARGTPLSITLHGDIPSDVGAVLKQHAPQLQTLQLALDSPGELLEEMSLTSLPILQKLSIEATEWGLASYIRNCVATLRAAPILADCEFVGMMEQDEETQHECPRLTHPSLRRLRLGRLGGDPSSSRLLPFLTLPSLQHLSISWLDIPHAELLSFFRRSAPPLQSLCLKTHAEHDWVALVPSLVSLTLVTRRKLVGDPIPVLDQMARDHDVLPNLRKLFIECSPSDEEDYEDLVTVITSRRTSQQTQLRSFTLIFPLDGTLRRTKPADDTIEMLSQYGKEGIQIYIGLETKNYIPSVDDWE